MKTVILMKGLSGSGKSTRAEQIIHEYKKSGYSWEHCSADNYFVDFKTGKYQFDPTNLKKAHQYCKELFLNSLQSAVELVVVDNTNIQRWEYQYYLDIAKQYGYEVQIEVVGNRTDIKEYAARNQHGLTEEMIQRQADRWED